MSEDGFSRPVSPDGCPLAQLSFTVRHLLLLPALLVLTRPAAIGRSRAGRVGAGTAAAGMAPLAVLEIVGGFAARDEAVSSDRAQLVSALHGIPTVPLGAG